VENLEQQPIVQLKNLSKVINGKQIIDDLTLDIYPGQITGFLGPNGSGKTTTIRLMTGLMSLTGGEVIIDGVSLQKDYENAIKNVGVIVENPEMYKYLSGYKNLLHFTRMHTNISKERIDEVVRQVGLENRIHEKVSTYSLGMRQRLGLAQSLLHNPKFLILDEPTNGLDPAGIREFRNHLYTLSREHGVGIFVSSHLLSEMELMCDRIAVIQSGKLIDVRDIKTETTTVYAIEAAPIAAFEAILAEKSIEFTTKDTSIEATVTKDVVPELIREAVAQNVSIYRVQPVQKTLEDQFLEMTGGGAIAETNSK
jgi:ABC-2 type transport system ATP-binding protein